MSQLRDALIAERDKAITIQYEKFSDAAWNATDFITKPNLLPGLYCEYQDDNFDYAHDPNAQLWAQIFCCDDDADPDIEFRLHVAITHTHESFTGTRVTLHRKSKNPERPDDWFGVGQVKTIADVARLLELDKETE
jgi:hypothetical protein